MPTAADHSAAGTCFAFIPCPDAAAEAAAAHARIAAALPPDWLPPHRLAAQAEAIGRWETVAAPERALLAARLGWRAALFADHDWWLAHVTTPPSASPAAWLRTQINRLPAEARTLLQPPAVDPAALVAHGERLLAGDLSPAHLPGYWSHRGAIVWLPPDGTPIDNEIVIQALRLYPHRTLAHAWQVTGDRRFADAALALLADLVWETPGTLIQRVGLGGCRTHWAVDALDVAVRCEHLLAIVALLAPMVDDPAARLLGKLLWLCGARGHEFWHKANHNIAFFEAAALARLAACWTAFRDAPVWRRDAQLRLADVLHGALLADGSNIEGQFGYHSAYLVTPARVVATLTAAGHPLEPSFATAWREHAAPALDFWARIATPDRALPNLGDGFPTAIRDHLRDLAAPCGAPFAAAVASADPAAWPRETSCWLAARRLAVLRSGWDDHATWAAVDLRGFHAGHDHFHLGHVQLHAGACALLTDSGVIDYNANRARSRATSAHNTLAVDGRDHAPGAAVDLAIHLTPDVDWVSGLLLPVAEGLLYRRAVCFVKPDWLLVVDRVTPLSAGPARTLRWYWHLGLGLTPALAAHRLQATMPGGPGLDLSLAASHAVSLTRETGFIATGYLEAKEAPVAVVGTALTEALACATLLRVVPPGATVAPVALTLAPLQTARPGGPAALPWADGCTVTATDGARTVDVLWTEPGAGRCRVGDWTTDGALLVAVTAGATPVAHAVGASAVAWRGAPAAWHPFPPLSSSPLPTCSAKETP